MFEAINTIKKTGREPFFTDNGAISLNVLSFWQWSNSELLGNTLRGVLAEFIIASSIDILDKPREEWDAYDLETNNGLKIEVKSSAYLQSWKQNNFSKISFGIQPTVEWDEKTNLRASTSKRQSDVYIFCVLHHKDKATVNPLDLSQWTFYILNTEILNTKKANQKTITLASLLKLNPTQVNYENLKDEIINFENTIYSPNK